MSAVEEVTWDLEPPARRRRGRSWRGEPTRRSSRPCSTARETLADEFADAPTRARSPSSTAPGLREAMEQIAEISELAGRAANFAHLRFAADTEDPANGALMQMVTERGTAIQTKLLFFELEWVEVPDERAEELLATDGLEFAATTCGWSAATAPHLLSQAGGEDRDRAVGHRPRRLEPPLRRAHLGDPGRPRGRGRAGPARRRALAAVRPRPRRAPDDRRGGHRGARARPAHPRLRLQHAAPGQGDQGPPARLPALARHPQPLQRGLRRVGPGAGRGGQGPLRAGAPLVRDQGEAARHRAPRRLRPHGRRRRATTRRSAGTPGRELVLDSFASFSAEAGDDRRAASSRAAGSTRRRRPSKRGGAFRASTVPSVHPYVMLNYTDRRRDVLTLAHELGHGLHQTLAREQGVFHQDTPLTVAETASVFAEEIVFGRLLDAGRRPRLAARPARRGGRGPDRDRLPPDRDEPVRGPRPHRPPRRGRARRSSASASSGLETQDELLGDSVEITDGYRSWWSYVPHFIGSPGYVYAYAYGQLLALSVYRLYTERGDEMVPAYLEMLAAGGSPLARGAGQDRRRRPHRPRLLGLGPRPRRGAGRPGGRGGRGGDRRARERADARRWRTSSR